MATHSSVLARRIPGTGEPGGLPSVGSHRVGHDWSDLAAAAAASDTHAHWRIRNTALKHTHTHQDKASASATFIKPSRGVTILHHKGCPQFWLPSKLFQRIELTGNRPRGCAPVFTFTLRRQVGLNINSFGHITGYGVRSNQKDHTRQKIYLKCGLAKYKQDQSLPFVKIVYQMCPMTLQDKLWISAFKSPGWTCK